MSRPSCRLVVWCVFAISIVIVGCGKPVPQGMVRVTGTISYEGKNLPDGTINFDAANGGRGSATARIQSDGSFAAVMPPGTYRAMVCSQDGLVTFDGLKPIEPPSRIPQKYGHPDTSGLLFTIPPENGRLTITLE